LFPSTLRSANDVWIVELPNKRAVNYVTNLNVYNAAVEARTSALQAAQNEINNAQVALDQANANLAQRKAQARPAEIAAAQAQLLSARGQLEAALANLENGTIRAPANGTITTVDIKIGEQAQALKNVIVLQDVDNLHVEANVSEASIASVTLGQKVTFTFDALGPDRVFNGTVQAVDPASTVVSGVVNYKVTAAIEKLPEIRPGMTANMTILTAEQKGVLAIPQRAVITKDGNKTVRVVTDEKTKTFKEVTVETGLEADGGVVEIKSGLSEGQTIITFIPTK
jgi:HlyD family secretion protein